MKTTCALALALLAAVAQADQRFLLGYGHKNYAAQDGGRPQLATRPLLVDPLNNLLQSYNKALPRVHGQKAVKYNDRYYLIGGRQFTEDDADATLLDLSENAAHLSAKLPFHVHKHAVATTLGADFGTEERILLSCGGIDASTQQPTKKCWVSLGGVDANGLSQWMETAQLLPLARAGHTMTHTAQGAIVIGGDAHKTVLQRDPTGGDFIYKKSLPLPLTNHAALLMPGNDNQVLVCGGVSANVVRAECYIFDAVANTWEETKSMEVARHSFELLNDNGQILVVGGVDQSNNYVPTVELLHLVDGSMALQTTVKAANFPAVPM